MYLQREFFLAVQYLDQQRKTPIAADRCSHHFFAMVLHEPPQILARQGTINDYIGSFRTIGDLPGLTYAHFWGQILVV